MKGMMIDCSRICERPDYYRHLIDCLADWGQDTLILHFCDDQGFGIVLPGFEAAAHPWAVSHQQAAELVAHAQLRGIRLIPEIETFGHTSWVTRLSGYEQCFLGFQQDPAKPFNAIDPLHPDTHRLMDRLLDATCNLFDDPVIHIGCDEVGLGAYCHAHDLNDPDQVWADYVNGIFERVRSRGRVPMFWADHAEKSPTIRRLLNKDVIAIAWHYWPHFGDQGLRALKEAGFREVVAGPAAGFFNTRSHSHSDNCANMRWQARCAARHDAGYITTLWYPSRHLQRALDHGLCFGAIMADSAGTMDGEQLDALLAERLFDSDDPRVRRFCRALPLLYFDNAMSGIIHADSMGSAPLEPALEARCRQTVAIGQNLLPLVTNIQVPRYLDRWQACLLAARTTVHCARCLLEPDWRRHPDLADERPRLMRALEAEWDATRHPQDPARPGICWWS